MSRSRKSKLSRVANDCEDSIGQRFTFLISLFDMIPNIQIIESAASSCSSRLVFASRVILTVAAISFLLFAFVNFNSTGSQFFSSASSSNSTCGTTSPRPVFVWMFGYVGDYYWPQFNNSVAPQQMISTAQSISNSVGKANLRIVGAVDVEPGHNINQTTVPNIEATIRAYVGSLKTYSAVVYGRIDMEQFHDLTSLKAEFSLFTSLGLNGVFFDLAPIIYNNMGELNFNNMMQQLTNSFPNICYLFNQSNPTITLLHEPTAYGNTWWTNAYVSPTVYPGSLTTLNLNRIAQLNGLYPGHVIIHYDANAGLGLSEPMAYFADHIPSAEESAIHTLASEGFNYWKASSSHEFNILIPVFGAWTANTSIYHGTLYNGLSVGTFSHGTLTGSFSGQPSFMTTMKTYP
jgi:hypothetical protein